MQVRPAPAQADEEAGPDQLHSRAPPNQMRRQRRGLGQRGLERRARRPHAEQDEPRVLRGLRLQLADGEGLRLGAAAPVDEPRVVPGPVPAEVRKTIDGALGPNARVTSEREGGKLIYEGARETKLEVEVSEQGQLLQTEVAIPVAALPDAVTKAFASKGTISEAEVVLRGSGVAFEIEVGNTEYVVDAAGNVLSSEAGEDGDGEGPDEDRD